MHHGLHPSILMEKQESQPYILCYLVSKYGSRHEANRAARMTVELHLSVCLSEQDTYALW